MNKQQLIKTVAVKANRTQKEVNIILNLALDTMINELKNGNQIRLIGFGNFETRNRRARLGWNPQTNSKVEITEKKIPAFKASSLLKAKINDYD